MRDVPAAGVKKLEQNFYVSARAVGFFLKESLVRDVPAAGARRTRRRRGVNGRGYS